MWPHVSQAWLAAVLNPGQDSGSVPSDKGPKLDGAGKPAGIRKPKNMTRRTAEQMRNLIDG
jgi:hypothetical protein